MYTLLATGLIGQAVLQVMTKTGARIGEVMQIRLTPEHLTPAWCTDRLIGAERLGRVEGRLPS